MKSKITFSIALSLFGAFTMMEAREVPVLKNQSAKAKIELKKRETNQPKQVVRQVKASQTASRISEVITEPEGKIKYYTKDAIVNYYGSYFEDEGLAAKFVFGEDNTVYIRDLIFDLPLGSYVKATIKDDVLVMDLPQSIGYAEEYGYGYDVSLVRYDEAIDNYVAVEGAAEFAILDDGTIILDLPGLTNDEYAIGIVNSDDGTYFNVCNTAQIYTPFEMDITQMPEDVQTETYYFNNGFYGHPLQVGMDSDHLYIMGLVEDMDPSTVIIADFDGETATISQDEFLGDVSAFFIFTKAVIIEDGNYLLARENDVCKLNVDFDNKIISYVDSSPLLCINAAIDRLFYLNIYPTLTLKMQDGFEGTPRDPFDLEFTDDYLAWYGYYSFYFTLPNVSTEDIVLKSEDLYYKVFIDGEHFVLEEDYNTGKYAGIGMAEEIPFLFSNGNDLFAYAMADREVGIYDEDITTLGVQSLYRYDGKVTESAIVTLNVKTGQVTVTEPDDTGVSAIENHEAVMSIFYDLNGRKVMNPETGLYIRKTVFADGKTEVKKVIIR